LIVQLYSAHKVLRSQPSANPEQVSGHELQY
jgi:hypothetical protein